MPIGFFILGIVMIIGWTHDEMPTAMDSVVSARSVMYPETGAASSQPFVSFQTRNNAIKSYHITIAAQVFRRHIKASAPNGVVAFDDLPWPNTRVNNGNLDFAANGTEGIIRIPMAHSTTAFNMAQLVNNWDIRKFAGVWSGTQIVFPDGTTAALPSGIATPNTGDLIIVIS